MAAIEVDSKITIGNLITIIITAGSMMGGYAALRGEQQRLWDKIVTVESIASDRNDIVSGRISVNDLRLRVLEVDEATITADIRNILNLVNDIKDGMSKTNRSATP